MVVRSRVITLLRRSDTARILTLPRIISRHPHVLHLLHLLGRLTRHGLLVVALQLVKQLVDVVCGDSLLVGDAWQDGLALLHACSLV